MRSPGGNMRSACTRHGPGQRRSRPNTMSGRSPISPLLTAAEEGREEKVRMLLRKIPSEDTVVLVTSMQRFLRALSVGVYQRL
jgi:hypothetical protein